ncbi:MAG: ferritin family protein [Chloroflexi bacterium]|nr:ferritin family protein [Chloroflexota bacterium]
MAYNEGLTALEVLGIAIKSEIEAASLYARMTALVRNTSLASKLAFLRQEEEKHREMLESLYTRRFPDVELQLPAKSPVPQIQSADLDDMTVPELFQLAMQAEQMAADFYSREADRSNDQAGRTMLRYLSNVEHGHYHLLQTEYELVSRFPSYYDADEFHFGDEMMHIGP